MRKLVTRLQAQLDVEDAALWYESQQPGLGLRFLDELDYVMKRIIASPSQFPEVHPRIRRGLVKRFPYSVYFSASDEQVEVVAVLHQHRHSDTWRNRL
jgi:plasmid stabilization system protein ParE